jgi:hypothetical protein
VQLAELGCSGDAPALCTIVRVDSWHSLEGLAGLETHAI